ncbi:DUF397 domain-containing protein [Streptomyces prunicolor]
MFIARPATGPIAVKDGKTPHGPVVAVDRDPWTTFVQWASK